MMEIDESKDILAKIIVLYDHIDAIKDRFPGPKSKNVADIIRAFEQRILAETEKLKDLEKND